MRSKCCPIPKFTLLTVKTSNVATSPSHIFAAGHAPMPPPPDAMLPSEQPVNKNSKTAFGSEQLQSTASSKGSTATRTATRTRNPSSSRRQHKANSKKRSERGEEVREGRDEVEVTMLELTCHRESGGELGPGY